MTAHKRRARKFAAGAPPGTLEVDPNALRSLVTILAYGPGDVEETRPESLDQVRRRSRVTT